MTPQTKMRDAYTTIGTKCEQSSSVGHNGHRLDATVAGIVLAGTQSWGQCPLERILPRPLAPILNKPIVRYALDWLWDAGVGHAAICGCTHALRRGIIHKDESPCVPDCMDVEYFHDIAPRGPAGCVRDAAFCGTHESYVAIEGTILPLINLQDLIERHQSTGAAITVVVSTGRRAGAHGVETLTPVGIYVFSRRALQHIPPAGYQDIKEALIPRLYQCGDSVLTYRTDVPVPRVGGIDSYLAVNEWALNNLASDARIAGFKRMGEAWVHPSATVHASAALHGPVLVGPGSTVGRQATILGPTTIGRGCRIGERSVVCRSALWDNAVVNMECVLDRCIVTTGAVVRGEAPHRYVVAYAS